MGRATVRTPTSIAGPATVRAILPARPDPDRDGGGCSTPGGHGQQFAHGSQALALRPWVEHAPAVLGGLVLEHDCEHRYQHSSSRKRCTSSSVSNWR